MQQGGENTGASVITTLRTGHGTYVSARADETVAVESHVLDEETFELEWIDAGKHTFALRSCPHGTYLTVSSNAPYKISMQPKAQEEEQQFVVAEVAGTKCIKSAKSGLFLTNADPEDPASLNGSSTFSSAAASIGLEDYPLPHLPGHYLNALLHEGYCLLPSLISAEKAKEAKALITALEEKGVGLTTEVQHRVPDLINEHPIFVQLCAHPIVVGLLRIFLGRTMRCATFSSNTLKPQDGSKESGLGWHVDYPYHDIPLPWPPVEIPMGAQALWSLDAFTEQNGGTMFQERTHLLMKKPNYDFSTPPGSRVLECPIGSVMLAHSAWWHRQTKNVSDNSRAALLGNYTPGFVVPKDSMENQLVKLHQRPDVEKELSLRDGRVMERLCVGNFKRGVVTSVPPLATYTDEYLFGGHSFDIYSGLLKGPQPN